MTPDWHFAVVHGRRSTTAHAFREHADETELARVAHYTSEPHREARCGRVVPARVVQNVEGAFPVCELCSRLLERDRATVERARHVIESIAKATAAPRIVHGLSPAAARAAVLEALGGRVSPGVLERLDALIESSRRAGMREAATLARRIARGHREAASSADYFTASTHAAAEAAAVEVEGAIARATTARVERDGVVVDLDSWRAMRAEGGSAA